MKSVIRHHPGRSLALLFTVLLFAACSGSGNAEDGESASAILAEAMGEEPGGDPVRISKGERVDLKEHAVAGQFTVFDFMSDYCPPCQRIAPWMDRLHKEREGVSVVKVDINRPGVRGIDWKSPVAAQFGLSSIPHFKVMDAEGAIVAEGDQAWEMVVAWLEQLPSPEGSDQG